ncbi:MAG: FixG Ig-like domain-containing protein, partial [Magnetospiraceae bacterium]
VQLSSGDIRNAYTFKILNMERKDGQYELALSGIEGAAMTVVGKEEARGVTSVDLIASPDTVEQYRILVEAPRKSLKDKSVPLEFHLRDKDTGEIAEYDTVFVGPGR